MNENEKLYLFPILLLLAFPAIGQALRSAKADNYYNEYQFAYSSRAYEKVLKSEPGNAVAIARLVQCYVRLGNTGKARHWLDKAVDLPVTDVRYYRELAAVLAMNGRYAEAGRLFEKAAEANDQESLKWQQAYKDLSIFYEDSLLYEINIVYFNASSSDFSPALLDHASFKKEVSCIILIQT